MRTELSDTLRFGDKVFIQNIYWNGQCLAPDKDYLTTYKGEYYWTIEPCQDFERDLAGLGSVKIFHASGERNGHPETTLTVPDGYKILGGGARVNWSDPGDPGNLLTASFPKDARTWVAKSKDHGEGSPADIDVWAIAIYDPKNECEVKIFPQESAKARNLFSVTATVPEGYVLTGGGAQANWTVNGNLLTASYPNGSTGWVAKSKSHAYPEEATITAYAIGIKAADGASKSVKDIFEKKNFETRLFTHTSAKEENHPTAEIAVDSDYVLVGGGAYVDWDREGGKRKGNLLTASYPASLNTWKVASKDHLAGNEDPSKITAYAIGARVK